MSDHRIAVSFCAAWLASLPCAGLAQPASVSPPQPGEPTSAQPGVPPGGAAEPEAATGSETLTGTWGGLRPRLEAAGIKLGLEEQSEVWSNVSGGVHRGFVYNGLTTLSLEIDLEKAVGWNGASFFVDAFQIHGRGPTPNLVGNLQGVSGIEANRATRLYDLYLEQSLLDGKLSIRIGQEGADGEFMISKYGAVFLGSSFGFPANAAINLPSGGPNYPLPALFVRAKYQVNDAITLLSGVFNGNPAGPGDGDPQERDGSGTAFRLGDGVFAISELWYDINKDEHSGGLPGTYKIGAWYHSGNFRDQRFDVSGRSLALPDSPGIGQPHWNNYAGYVVADQMLWRGAAGGDQGVRAFGRVSAGPGDRNLVDVAAIGGLSAEGLIPGRPDDVVGIGVAYTHISSTAQALGRDLVTVTGSGQPFRNNETVLEATYLYQVAPWWTLQGDIQYVANPGVGIPSPVDNFSRTPLKNATVLGLRATIVF